MEDGQLDCIAGLIRKLAEARNGCLRRQQRYTTEGRVFSREEIGKLDPVVLRRHLPGFVRCERVRRESL